MPPSVPSPAPGSASGGNAKKSLSQLIRLRDAKRQTLSQLFEEKKRIMQRMKVMNDELMDLDDEIEALEEQRDQQRMRNNISPQPPSMLEVKPEPVTSNQSPQRFPATQNPDEILTEPTQNSPMRNYDDEILTEPTQTQAGAASPPVFQSSFSASNPQKKQRSAPEDDIEDYYYDDGDDHAVGPPVNHSSIIESNNNNGDSMNHSGSNEARLRPLHLESVPGPKSAPSNYPQTTGTIDNFFNPNGNKQGNPHHASSSAASSCPYSTHDIHQCLRQSFRLQSFRENQLEIIKSTLSGRDNFVLMKTGGGKSLLYQLPAVLESPKITVVVSPLLSLIQDQEDQMNSFVRNSCVSFTSGMGTGQHNENWKRVRDVGGGIMMILVTPERVFKSGKLKSELQNLDEQNRLGRFVIDECHCACQWGHDFRPDYAKLRVLRQHFPHVPILAVTATASEQVRKECVQIFQLSSNHAFFRSTADRPNLTYQVRPKEAKVIQDMAEFIKSKHPRSAGIVYAYSRKDADTVASELCEEGIIAESYHSDVSSTRKTAIHKSWMQNRTQVVVATIAFGLGINKPDVRFVLHHTLSKTLESYYQESGRAGRDGKSSDCVLYYSAKDVPRMLKMIHGDSTEHLFLTMVKYAQQFGDDQACRALILQNMGEPNQNPEKFRGLSDGVEFRDVTPHAITLLQLMNHFRNKNVTMNMLITEWRKGPSTALECVKNNPPGKDLTKEDGERMIVGMLVNGLVEPVYRFNAYGTVVYLQCTENAIRFITSDKAFMRLPLPKPATKKRKAAVLMDKDGWVDTKSTKKKTATSSSKKATSKKKSVAKKTTKPKAKAKTKATKKPRSSTASKSKPKAAPKTKDNEVIELSEDSDDDSQLELVASIKKRRPRRVSTAYTPVINDGPSGRNNFSDDEFDNEFEFK